MSQEKAAEIIDFNATLAGVRGDFETAGAFLAEKREAAGMSVEAIADATKVKPDHIRAIEATRPDLLPATPYAVGFVKVYAQFLGLDAEALASQFRADIGAAAAETIELKPLPTAPVGGPVSSGARIVSAIGIFAILVFALWMATQILGGGRESEPAPAPEISMRPANAQPSTPVPGAASDLAPVQTVVSAPKGPAPEEANEGVAAEEAAIEPEAIADEAPIAADRIVRDEPAASPSQPPVRPEPQIDTPVVQATPEPVRQRPVIVASRVLNASPPAYPNRCARRADPLESVTLVFDVTTGGRTANARIVSSTNACFEAEALRTLARWRFAPQTVNGAPRAEIGKQATLNFSQ